MSAKILIVEDDADMAELVRTALAAKNHKVSVRSSAEAAVPFIAQSQPDLLVLDLMLGGMSGLQLCDFLKKDPKTASLPILMLTTLSKDKEKVAGLKTGADDYVTKPFSMEELCARVDALLRRTQNKGQMIRVLEAGAIRLRVETRDVFSGEDRVELSRMEFDLLQALLEKPDWVHTYDALAQKVWGEDRIATSHTVTATVSRMKDKLGKSGRVIEAVPGVGYRLRAE